LASARTSQQRFAVPAERHAQRIFPSRTDGALAPLLAGLLVAATLASRLPVLPGRGLVLAAPLGGLVLAVWVLLVTRYTLDGEFLSVRSGPFSRVLACKQIRAATRTRDPRTAPAVSLQHLRIDRGAGRATRVSPREEAHILAELRARGVPLEV
jgi:hypothetical protein